MKKIISIICISICFSFSFLDIYASQKSVYENTQESVFSTLDKEGNVTIWSPEKLEKYLKAEDIKIQNNQENTINYGVVNFKTKSSSLYNTTYTDANTGEIGYLNGYYATDGAFLGFNKDVLK